MDDDPIAIVPPSRSEWDKWAPANPRLRCGVEDCGAPLVVATIDRGRVKKEKKVGRPRKDARLTRYTKIGYYCTGCGLFYYPNLSPNYKMRLIDKIKRKIRRRKT